MFVLKTLWFKTAITAAALLFLFAACNNNAPQTKEDNAVPTGDEKNEDVVKRGEHLVIISACHDCHTPKKMTARGPVLDSSLLLSGHPSQLPPPDVNRREIESIGLALTNEMLTAWIGP